MEKPLAMHTFENLNIGEVCRSCFESCEQYKMLYEDAENSEKRSLGDVFFDVVKIEVKTSIDQSPSRICLACFRDLINAYNFIQKSKHNNDRFVEYLKTTGLRQDCLSEFPIDIPNDTTPADYHLQIKIENEAINDYDDSLADDKISPGSTSGSADSSDYEEPLHNKVKINKMQCPYCERIFKRQDFLENHKRKHEEEIKKKKEAGEEISTFVCDECGLSFGIKKDFDEHLTNEHPARVCSSERENSEKRDGFFRSRRPPPDVVNLPQPPPQPDEKSDIAMLKLEITSLKETCMKEFSEIKALLMKQYKPEPVKEGNYPKRDVEEVEPPDTQGVLKFTKLFPINTEEQLKALDGIDEDQKLVAIATAKQLIHHGGLCSNMNRIFGNRIIVNYNYEGKRGKKSLKELNTVNEILFRAAFKTGYVMADYESDLRRGFKIMKNRYFKNECIRRKNQTVNPGILRSTRSHN